MYNSQPKPILPTVSNSQVLKLLSKSKFPVFLVQSDSRYALKAFPAKNGRPSDLYLKEASFSNLKHENIVNMVHTENLAETPKLGLSGQCSFILMEYAPFGDFADIILEHKFPLDEKLVRTFFQQLISGIEYLHTNGVAHLDLKAENLLLGENFILKIADFDLSYQEGDSKIFSHGTRYFRAPEVICGNIQNPYKADIFSAAMLLFTFKAEGTIAQNEDQEIYGRRLIDLMFNNPDKFWKFHIALQKRATDFFNDDFKHLFLGMTRFDPEQRFTIEEIKSSNWYNGPVYSQEEVIALLSKYY